ncbi:LysR family transcriptional regulator [Bosea sp. LC85]|uniref:LysR family transcriptional regulator n=1 Tax=Bosea sp. LC85 TaxID=1502851 RepID=UPI001FCBDE3E|nr:LysR family transcriptional regulator substrate-binding protein [Bosea sp. LC85]
MLRRPRNLELTPAGRALLDYCREVGAAEEHLRHRLSAADEKRGEISLISPGSIGLTLYPRLLALQEKHPGLSIRHRFAPTQEVVEAVLSSRFELGLVTIRPDDPRLAVEKFAEEPLELIAPAGERVENWEDLQRLGFIDHPDGEAMATRLLRARFPGNPGLHGLRRSGFTNQIALILEPVSRGLGFTVLPQHARESFAQPEKIQVVPGKREVCDTLWLIHRAEWPLSRRARLMLDRRTFNRTHTRHV